MIAYEETNRGAAYFFNVIQGSCPSDWNNDGAIDGDDVIAFFTEWDAGNADFNIRSFRTTNVLRWEYKPGSSLFVVWQQGKFDAQDRGDFRFGRDFSGLFAAPSHNVFLVKFSYWLNM